MMSKKLISGSYYSKGAWLPVFRVYIDDRKGEREPLLRKALD